MQRSVFVFCFLLIQLFASGQEKFLSFKCTGNVGEPIIANKIVNEKDSAVLLTLISKGSIRRITSEPGKAPLLVLQQVNTEEEREDNPLHTSRISFSQLANYRKHFFLGGLYHRGQVTELFRNRDNFSFFIVHTDLNTGSLEITDLIKSKGIEKIIDCYDRDGVLTLITYIAGRNTLIVYQKKEDQPVASWKLEISTAFINSLSLRPNGRIRKFSDLLVPSNFAVFKTGQHCPALVTQARTKAFIVPEGMVFTVTTEDLATHLIRINFDQRNYEVRSYMEAENYTGGVAGNSFLYDSLLVTAFVKDDSLMVHLRNLQRSDTGQFIRLSDKNIDSFAAQKVFKKGTFLSRNDVSEKNFHEYIQNIHDKPLSVSAYVENGQIFLSFATTLKPVPDGTFLMGLLNLAAYGLATYNFPQAQFHYPQDNETAEQNNIGFQFSLNGKDYSPAGTPPDFSAFEKLSNFPLAIEPNQHPPLSFYMNGAYYLGYFYPEQKKYMVYRFDEKGVD